MSQEQFELMAAGISRIEPGWHRSVEEKALRAQQVIDEHSRQGDITEHERSGLRFLVAEVMRMNAKSRVG